MQKSPCKRHVTCLNCDKFNGLYTPSVSRPCLIPLQVGDYASEMGTWDRPEDMTTPRANITISTANSTATAAADLVGNAAAALAAASVVWETADTAYAAQALIAAKDLYTFAQSVSTTCSDHCALLPLLFGGKDICLMTATLALMTELAVCKLPSMSQVHCKMLCEALHVNAMGTSTTSLPCVSL